MRQRVSLVLAGGFVLAAGAGALPTGNASGAVDPAAVVGAAWTNQAPLPEGVFGASATAAAGLGYAGGGFSFTTSTDLQTFYSWDPDTNAWTPLAQIPDAQTTMASMVYGRNGKIYLFGGESAAVATVSAATRIYDIATNSWSAGAAMPDIRAFMGAGYYDGGIYLAGGYIDTSVAGAQNQLWRYDIGTDSWTTLPAMPAALGGPGSAVLGDQLYIVGGRDAAGTVLNSFYAFDFGSNSWSTLGPLAAANNVPGAAVFSGTLWVYGGGNPFLTGGGTLELPDEVETTGACISFDAATGMWSSCPVLNVARSFAGSAAVRNVPLAVGGFDGVTSIPGVEANLTAPGELPLGEGYQLIVSGETLGFSPNGYYAEAINFVETAFLVSRPAPQDFALFQTHDPWSATVVKDAIDKIGRSFTEFPPAALAGFPFADYRVVVLNWDDHFATDFETDYLAALPALESYVRGGGTLWVQSAFQGSLGESIPLPLGGTLELDFDDMNVIVDPTSPLMTALVSPIFGGSASHASVPAPPAGAQVVKRGETAGGPAVVYVFGPLIFVDGFESANTSRWSATVP